MSNRSQVFTLDPDTYVERRTQIADEAFARIDGLAAQNARRHQAIKRTVETLRRIINSEQMSPNCAARIHGLILDLTRSNEARRDDDTPATPSRLSPEQMGRPIRLELVEDGD